MKMLEIVKTKSSDGELHFIFLEATDRSKKNMSTDMKLVKKNMKKQASKALLLLREE